MPDYRQENPANYVPLPAAGRRPSPVRVDHSRLDENTVTGVITLRITTIDPVRVGQGSFLVQRGREGAVLLHDQAVRDQLPCIPGSSIKGAIRSLAEAVLGGCDVPGSCRPICYACGLFGYVAGQDTVMGRVGFEDAVAEDAWMEIIDVPTAYPPRKPVGRRAYGPRPPEISGKEPAVVIRPGSRFLTRWSVQGLLEKELGALVACLGLDARLAPRLGGGKHFGMGRVAFGATKAVLRGPSYRREELTGQDLADRLGRWWKVADLTDEGKRALAVARRQMPREDRR